MDSDKSKPTKPSPPKDGVLKSAKANPALQMLGIKYLKVPSPKWLAFWGVLSVVLGGIAYDKWQQKQQRKKYMGLVEPLGRPTFQPNQTVRKVRIYAAPPPNDFLNETLKYFRRFVKPILNSAAIDFELVTEDRQGRIRSTVAEEIRKLRRAKLGLPDEPEKKEETPKEIERKNPRSLLSVTPSYTMKLPPVDREEAEEATELKKVADLYQPNDVLGVTKQFADLPPMKVVSEDSQAATPQDAGGIVCIGRGAYKEYLHGVHEGLLGPLYEPERPKVPPPQPDKPLEEMSESERKKWDRQEKERLEDEADRPPFPYILPGEYASNVLAPELNLTHPDGARDENGVPYFFLQPVEELRLYSTAGFRKQPERIRRFYNKRAQQVEYNEWLYGLITKKHRPFQHSDIDWGILEEDDWPAKWVAKGIEKQSDWCRELVTDERVEQLMSVYERERINLDTLVAKDPPKVERERKGWVN